MGARWFAVCAALILSCSLPAAAAKRSQPYFENLSPSTYLPGADVVLTVAHPPDDEVAVYAVPVDREIDFTRGFDNSWDMVSGLTRVASGRLKHGRDGITRSLDIGALPQGGYAASVGSGKAQCTWMFSVTSFGILTSAFGSSTTAWLIDLRTLNSLKQPASVWVVSRHARRRLLLDADGVAVDRTTQRDSDNLIVAIAADGSRQMTREGDWTADVRRTFITTDRPIYRPGQTVKVRAILRDGAVGAYTIPHGYVRIKVTSERDRRVISDRRVAITPFGSVSAAVRLPHDSPPQNYEIAIGTRPDRDWFTVVAYKKPEATLSLSADRPWTISGEDAHIRVAANYLFGRPAAGMHLHYVVTLEGPYDWPARDAPDAWWRDRLDGYSYRAATVLAAGDSISNARGQYDVAFKAPPVTQSGWIEALVEGSDASGRRLSARLTLVDQPASFAIGITPDRWFTATAQRDNLQLHAANHDNIARANQTLTLEIIAVRWNSRRERYDQLARETHEIATDSRGDAVFGWTPGEPGTFELRVDGADERARTAFSETHVVVANAGQNDAIAFPDERAQLVPEKQTLARGEPARLLVVLPAAGRDIEVAVASDHLSSLRIVHVTGRSIVLVEQPPPDAAHFSVSVALPTVDGLGGNLTSFRVVPPPRWLKVSIAPNKARYVPGEEARLNLDVRDTNGKPVRAEVGVSVVDEAIYALATDDRQPFAAFYEPLVGSFGYGSWDMTQKTYRSGLRTIANVRAGLHADASTYSVRDAGVRANFQDTALWAPAIVTDLHGHAQLRLRWPDDLTTWRATGTAVTMRTDIGMNTADSLVTKDFLVRLETPRFLRVGDRPAIVGIAQGVASDPAVRLRLATSASDSTAAVQTTLDAGAMASVSWPITAASLGSVGLTLYGEDGRRSDAMRRSIPVEGITPEQHLVSNGSGNGSVRIAIPPDYAAGALTVTLSPSIVGQLLQSLHLLQVYPYDCTEQTLSAALPALFVERYLQRTRAQSVVDVQPRTVALKALDRLEQLRHYDGSYGWWEHDAPHPFMTAYALYGLAEYAKAGYSVSLESTVNSLIEQLALSNNDTLRFWGGKQPGSEWNTRAFMLFALADAAPQRVDGAMLAGARAHAGAMNPYALAVLGLAEHAIGDDSSARQLLSMLDKRAIDDGTNAFWTGQTWEYAWEDDPVETTAYALRLEVALDPANPRIPRIVNFLRVQMRDGWAYTTKDTAATIYALSEALPTDANELHPAQTFLVRVDGRTYKRVAVTRPVLDAADEEVVIPAGTLRAGSEVRIEHTGVGALYWSSDFRLYPPTATNAAADRGAPLLERLFPNAAPIAITRRYRPEFAGPWHVGERVAVDLTISSRRDLEYVSVEDPFPAGAEHSIDSGMARNDDWSGATFLDDRATFFASRVAAGTPLTLHYMLDLTTAGTYTAPAPVVYSMYGPPIKAFGEPERIAVLPAL